MKIMKERKTRRVLAERKPSTWRTKRREGRKEERNRGEEKKRNDGKETNREREGEKLQERRRKEKGGD